jgi:hypothetical protein
MASAAGLLNRARRLNDRLGWGDECPLASVTRMIVSPKEMFSTPPCPTCGDESCGVVLELDEVCQDIVDRLNDRLGVSAGELYGRDLADRIIHGEVASDLVSELLEAMDRDSPLCRREGDAP